MSVLSLAIFYNRYRVEEDLDDWRLFSFVPSCKRDVVSLTLSHTDRFHACRHALQAWHALHAGIPWFV